MYSVSICCRSSACDRPRTYDKFYQKGPGNFHDPSQTDSAISVCSSETEEDTYPYLTNGSSSQRIRRRKKKKGLQYSRTITEKDVRSIERHLSMKKTIRKKIMRDLQQAFVGDPNEFAETVAPERQKEINLDSLKFDPKQNDPKFLDLLRGENSDDSGHSSSVEVKIGRTGRVVHQASKPTYQRIIFSDSSSSCGGDDSLESGFGRLTCREDNIMVIAAEQIEARGIDGKVLHAKSDLKKKKLKNKQKNNQSAISDSDTVKKKSSIWNIFSSKSKSS